MASTQMTRVDAFGLLPSLLIVLMSILADPGRRRPRGGPVAPEHDPATRVALGPPGPWPRLGRPSDPGPPYVRTSPGA